MVSNIFSPRSVSVHMACPANDFSVLFQHRRLLCVEIAASSKRKARHAVFADSQEMCNWCPANRSTANWADFRLLSVWMPRLYTADDPQATPALPIFRLPGVTIFTFAHDTLHIVDKGTATRILGCCIWTFVQDEPQITGGLDTSLCLGTRP